jgi:hypothetical protein
MKISLQLGLPDVPALEQFLKISGALPHAAEKLARMCRKPAPGTRFVAAYDQDRLIGVGCWAITRASDSAEIEMAVDPAYAGREISEPMRKLLVPAKSVVRTAAAFHSA